MPLRARSCRRWRSRWADARMSRLVVGVRRLKDAVCGRLHISDRPGVEGRESPMTEPKVRSNPCPLCGAARTLYEKQVAECFTCKRDTWEDCGGVNMFDVYITALQERLSTRSDGKPHCENATDVADVSDRTP